MILPLLPTIIRTASAVKVRWKIMGIVVAVILVLGGSVTYELAVSYERTLRTQVQEKGLTMARSLAARSANLVLTNQRYALFELASEMRKSSEDVEYVYIADASGQPLVDTFGQGFPRGLLGLTAPASQPFTVTRLATERGRIQDIAVPILGGRGGYAHVGVSEARIQGYVRENVERSLAIIAGVLVAGTAGAFALATVLTRPVERLVEATEALGRGEFDVRAPVWTLDEIGQLGIAFNAMAGELQVSSEALLQRTRDLEGLNAIASAANRSQDQVGVMNAALAYVQSLGCAEKAWIWLLDEDTERLHLAVHVGMSESDAADFLSIETCPCMASGSFPESSGEVRPNCPLLTPRLPPSLDGLGVACVPLRALGRPLGLMVAARAEARDLDVRERQLLLAIADQVSVALENARLLEELRRKEAIRGQLLEKVISAQEDERKRISRELHDETGQALTALAVGLRTLEGGALPEGDRRRLADIQALAANAINAVQSLAFQLRPSVLDEVGLSPAIERYVRSFGERYRVNADVQVAGMRERLPPATETALYRITQEALTNVARHAEASNVSVLLERRNGTILLLVEDDGKGFTPQDREVSRRERLGIHGMEERATLVGGKLTIESRPGAGTSVYVEIPVEEVEADA